MALSALSGMTAQERCDRLYRLLGSLDGGSLVGKTGHEIAGLLGQPDEVLTLEHDGIVWTRIVYACDALPAGATPEEQAAYAEGWRFSPSLLLCDGVTVREDNFDREVVGEGRTAGPSPELAFHAGGRFT
jgi:hypothetical protein